MRSRGQNKFNNESVGVPEGCSSDKAILRNCWEYQDEVRDINS